MKCDANGYRIEVCIGVNDNEPDHPGLERAAQIMGSFVKQGIHFDAIEGRGNYGERVIWIYPTGGY